VEEYADLHRQYHFGDLSHRHSGGLCYIAGIARVAGQGDDGHCHNSSGQLHCPLRSTLTTEYGR